MTTIERRDFLKKAGIGSLALASVPTWASLLSRVASADDDGGTGFFFVVVSHAGTSVHRIAVAGTGVVNDDGVEGGGSFVHWDSSKPAGENIVASGTWQTRRLLEFELVDDPTDKGGSLAAGELKMAVKLNRELPSPARIDATFEEICNLGFAGLSTGEEEGVTVAIPGTPFAEGADPGPFVPFVPAFGITTYTRKASED